MLDKQIKDIPKKVLWCKNCCISNQRPRIIFDENQICSACKHASYKENINWKNREEQLLRLLEKHRSKDGKWDVIVPSSGGKDSGFVAHQLKYKYGMNPLTVTWSPLEYTKIGKENFDALNNSGISNFLYTPNRNLQKKLAKLCFEQLGDAFHVFVLGQINFPFHMALKLNINLVFYGENGELEYAGDPKHKDKPYKPMSEWTKQHFKGVNFDDLIKFGLKKKYINSDDISQGDLEYYKIPELKKLKKNNIKGKYFFSYFKKWTPQENFYYCVDNTGFKPNDERTEGTYSKYSSLDDKMDGMHYYMRYIKFGLGRCCEETSHEIRDKHITRSEGIKLMKKYEGEFPKKYFRDFLTYLSIDEKNFWKTVDKWRSKNIWMRKNNKWVLRKPIK